MTIPTFVYSYIPIFVHTYIRMYIPEILKSMDKKNQTNPIFGLTLYSVIINAQFTGE